MAKTLDRSVGALAAVLAMLLTAPSGKAAEALEQATDCSIVGEDAAEPPLVAVKGETAPYRLFCREGRLTALPQAAETPLPPASDTGANAAGVAGQSPAATISEAVAEPLSMASKALDAGETGPAKPGVSAAAAMPDPAKAPGSPKSDVRVPAAAERAVETGEAPGTVRVPAPIIAAARRALPGVAFTSVDLSRKGASTVYGLAGKGSAGRAVATSVDQSGDVLSVDREMREAELPPEIAALARAMAPGARIERAMLSVRTGLESFFVFSGSEASGQPFTLDIRSDGRSLAFVDPQ